MQVSTVIFDLDGTILSNEDEWGKAFGSVLRQLGVKGVSKFPHIGGIGIKENWPYLIEKYDIKTDKNLDELYVLTKNEYEKLVPEITFKKGYRRFINDLKKSGILVVLATSSSWDILEKIFNKFNIEEDFDCITSGEEVLSKKPDPQVFEICVRKLGVEPKECLVIEDSQAGIQAARSAGMKVVGIARDYEHKKSLKKADLIIQDFNDITPEIISSL